MSAFVIRNQEMDRCVGAIFHERYGSYAVASFCGKPLEEWDKSELGRMLYAMNASAVAERYNEAPEDCSSYRFQQQHVGPIVAGIKALDCLHYQCSEGDTDQTEPYRELERVIGLLCASVVREMPAYQRAEW